MKKSIQPTERKRTRISQEDVPAFSLKEALRVPTTLHENFGKDPATPLRVAGALGMSPGSSQFKMLAGAAIAYGLTNGGCNAATIALQPLATRILKPTAEGDDLLAKREAFLKPKIIGAFLHKYDGSPLPKTEIGKNVLEDLGVPRERSDAVLEIITSGASELGLLQEIKGKSYVDLSGTPSAAASPEEKKEEQSAGGIPGSPPARDDKAVVQLPVTTSLKRRVYITHGKNRDFVEPIKRLLSFGEMEAVVSVEKQSVSQPVPDKVMNEMRSCSAAIIHVEDELKLLDSEAKEQVMLNPNVLIEIGAAMALFGRRFILLVKDGVRLPSNLQGLFEVRYTGDALDGNATIRLLEAINELKKLPEVQ